MSSYDTPTNAYLSQTGATPPSTSSRPQGQLPGEPGRLFATAGSVGASGATGQGVPRPPAPARGVDQSSGMEMSTSALPGREADRPGAGSWPHPGQQGVSPASYGAYQATSMPGTYAATQQYAAGQYPGPGQSVAAPNPTMQNPALQNPTMQAQAGQQMQNQYMDQWAAAAYAAQTRPSLLKNVAWWINVARIVAVVYLGVQVVLGIVNAVGYARIVTGVGGWSSYGIEVMVGNWLNGVAVCVGIMLLAGIAEKVHALRESPRSRAS